MSDRQKLFFALVVSAVIHIAIGLVLAISRTRLADEKASVRPDLSQLQVTIMPLGAFAPTPPARPATPSMPAPISPSQSRPMIESDGLTQSKKKPAHPMYQSDADMVAGSRVPPLGSEPLPSVEGPKRDFTDFANQSASIGKGETAAQARKAAARPIAPSRAHPTPPPVSKLAQQSTPPPATPVPTAKPTPTPGANTIALGKATPTPAPPAPSLPPAFHQPTPIAELARLTTPAMRDNPQLSPPDTQPVDQSAPQPPDPGTRKETDKSRVEGNISAVGDPGVDAESSPYGRYYHKLSSLIGSRWHLYQQQHPNDFGSVRIWFKLSRSGKVVATRIIKNNSADDLAEVSTKAIVESQLPPVPEDLNPFLNRDGDMEMTFSFEVYDPNNDPFSR